LIPHKNRANIAKHGISLEAAYDFNWDTALITEDTRKPYPEKRMIAQGWIDHRLHILVYTIRGSRLRIISLRKSNPKERTSYENQA